MTDPGLVDVLGHLIFSSCCLPFPPFFSGEFRVLIAEMYVQSATLVPMGEIQFQIGGQHKA